ncbi:acyl-CoA dehydrogenase family protein [Actinomadura sp. 7K507]|uniref:acyl-CoA dehydrogenase family protein n=1 Tax=Actinomadura sp. 7K507 TaxID=2530365 RepID=UPI001052D281|nr:acyl-CoA dehydrogenase family protein [Actinomadura sp. 7K507]TDC97609.1 acyl-CoA dehydrogenase [Actinomadura sp. 7K507]
MDLASAPRTEAFRRDVRRFLAERLPPGWRGIGALSAAERAEFRPRWRETLREHGFLGIAWPKEYGGAGLPMTEQYALQEEFAVAGAPLLPLASDPFGFSLIGPTILRWGTEEQKRHFIPRILSGEHRWAQGYSEPGAGSDLFALRTSASLVDGSWAVNGQKVWQTAGDSANWIFVLARTEPDASRSRGLSLLLVPIDQPGVDVRPIRTMTGEAEFCEVFFTGARTDASHIVGPRGGGAKVALTLLGYERGAASGALYAGYRIELERLAELIRERGLDADPQIRERFAWCWSKVEILRVLGLKTLAVADSGAAPGPESSILKLYSAEYHARVTELAMDVLGTDAMVRSGPPGVSTVGADPLGSPNSPAAWQHAFLTARAGTIYGGSSQIQRTTLGERVLGLPREPRPGGGKA